MGSSCVPVILPCPRDDGGREIDRSGDRLGLPVAEASRRTLRARLQRWLASLSSKPATICLLLGLLGALPLVVLTPPLQVPDEGQHFSRAYQLSELRLWSRVHDGRVGDELPTSLTGFILRFLGTTEPHARRGHPARPLDATFSELHQPLNPNDRRFLAFPTVAAYAPLPYAPQAAAIGLGRMAELGPLALLYLARLANALLAVGLVAAAVRLAPAGKEILLGVGLLPMALYEYASAAPDAMAIGGALVFTALALRLQLTGHWTLAEMLGAIACGLAFCPLKPVYLPILLIGLVPGVLRRADRGRILLTHCILVVLVTGATLAWLRSTASVIVPPRSGPDAPAQIGFVIHDPISFAGVLRVTLHDHLMLYYQSMVGVFGWMVVRSPTIAYMLPIVLVLLVCIYRDRRDARLPRTGAIWGLALALFCGLLVMTTLYVVWTPVGAPRIEGVQGRYFLPIAGIAGVALIGLLPRSREGVPTGAGLLCCATLCLVQLAIADMTIMSAFAVI